MSIIDLASNKSVWRGIDYYKENRVVSCDEKGKGIYDGKVKGSDGAEYSVHLDLNHPRKSSCDCPMANGKRVICKHIVALSFCTDSSEINRFKKEKTHFKSEKEERYAKKYDKYMAYAKSLSVKELREAFVELRIELDEIGIKEKYGKN